MPKEITTYLLTGDIGGTNSRMSLYDAHCSCTDDKPLVVKYYRNAEHLSPDSLQDPEAFQKHIIIPFMKYCWEEQAESVLVPLGSVQILACLATAGLVMNNSVRMTNLGDLLVDGTAIEANRKNKYLKHIITCRIINDFVAQGYGCLTLQPHEVRHLYGPVAAADLSQLPIEPKVCVGAGTGLGECYLTPDEKGHYTCFPSEGGHVEYAPRNDLEMKLWSYLSTKFATKGRISVERVVSGKGLANVYEFLAHDFPEQVIETVHQEFLNAGDQQGKVVATNASKENSLCHQAVRIMAGAYGCEVGSAAIKWIPIGGLFVTGGLTPKNIHFIEGLNSEFMLAYRNKGRVSPLLERIPLFAVMIEDLGVRGAHKAAKLEYERFLEEGIVGRTDMAGKIPPSAIVKALTDYAFVVGAAMISFAAGVFLSRSRR